MIIGDQLRNIGAVVRGMQVDEPYGDEGGGGEDEDNKGGGGDDIRWW